MGKRKSWEVLIPATDMPECQIKSSLKLTRGVLHS